MWSHHAFLLAPLSALTSIKVKFQWKQEHQEAFEGIKNALACEVLLVYLDYSLPFEIYTDASKRQMGAIITQNNRPITFWSRKLSDTQRKYTVTELELLSIVERLK